MTAARMGKGAVKAAELTAWFVRPYLPIRVGVYQVETVHCKGQGLWAWFDGKQFKYISRSKREAAANRKRLTFATITKWRGLASDPAKAAA